MSISLRTYSSYTDFDEDVLQGSVTRNYKKNANHVQFERINTLKGVEDKAKSDSTWFGSTDAKSIFEKKFEYLFLKDSETVYNKLKDKAVNVNIEDTIKKKRMAFNRYGFGDFSFARASMQMTVQKEYDNPTSGNTFGIKDVYKKNNEWLLTKDNSLCYERDKINPETGKRMVRSSVDDCYVYFPEQAGQKRRIALYMIIGANSNQEAEKFLYTPVGCLYLAQKLELMGIGVSIYGILGSFDGSNGYFNVFPVKNYSETVDVNLCSLVSADPRYFRIEGFRAVIDVYEHFGKKCPSGLGYLPTNDKTMINEIMEEVKTQNKEDEVFLFGMSYNLEQAVEQYNTIANKILIKK